MAVRKNESMGFVDAALDGLGGPRSAAQQDRRPASGRVGRPAARRHAQGTAGAAGRHVLAVGGAQRAAAAAAVVQKKSLHASEQERSDVAQRRAQWLIWRAGIDPRKLIFIDETWAKTNTTRLRGRSLRGECLVAKVPYGHWNTTTLIGVLGIDGVRCSTVVDGPVNRDIFEAFIGQVLAPCLEPGDIVVMDNLSSPRARRSNA